MSTIPRISRLASLTLLLLAAAFVPRAVAAPPPNDFFLGATTINPGALPFSETVDMTEATTEGAEPFYCNFSTQTVWYRFAPASTGWIGVNVTGGSLSGAVSVYRGGSIFNLTFVNCGFDSTTVNFFAFAGNVYFIQVLAPCCFAQGTMHVTVFQTQGPRPVAGFYYNPSDPSTFDNVQFNDNSYDPGGQNFTSYTWTFGDGSPPDSGYYVSHHFASDGDYTVTHGITTVDGRTDTTAQVVAVRTHDVAITKIKVPNTGSVGQTRTITVSMVNTRHPEQLHLHLLKSTSGSYYQFTEIASVNQLLPVRNGGGTTDYSFLYTFTTDDARIGKVSFEATADIYPARDALAADNILISSSVRVGGHGPSGPVPTSPEDPNAPLTEPAVELAVQRVVPNPVDARGNVMVHLSLPDDGPAALKVIDVSGRVVEEQDLSSLGRGVHEARLAWTRRPSPGIYWVELSQGGRRVTSRISVLN